MKILYFHQHFSSPKGSTGIRSYCMSRHMVEEGHEVTLICGSYLGSDTGLVGPFKNGCRRGVVDDINVIELELAYANKDGFFKRTITFFKYALYGLKFVFTENYDVVFSSSTPLTAGIPGIVARFLRNKIFFFEVRDLWPELPKALGVINNSFVLALMSFLEWVIYHSAHHVIALSPGIAKGIEKKGISLDKISLIPNGCDIDIFNTQINAWRPKEISDNDFLVLYAGTHGIANGLHSVLDAASEIKKRGRHEIKFLFLGQGKLKQSLIDRVISEGIDNVIFHEPVNKKKLSSLLASTDIGLQVLANIPAFYFGTSPNKFFDYISAGVPVLNNYPGWLAELIDEHDCGLSIPPEDPIAFADALQKASDNRMYLKIMGSKARALAVEKFDRKDFASQLVKKLETIYKKVKK